MIATSGLTKAMLALAGYTVALMGWATWEGYMSPAPQITLHEVRTDADTGATRITILRDVNVPALPIEHNVIIRDALTGHVYCANYGTGTVTKASGGQWGPYDLTIALGGQDCSAAHGRVVTARVEILWRSGDDIKAAVVQSDRFMARFQPGGG